MKPLSKRRGFGSLTKERRREIAAMGGRASGANFKNDPERASRLAKRGMRMRWK